MEQLERIRQMEARLNRGRQAVDALERALDAYLAAQEGLRELSAYYGGPDWKQDYADDEAGKLPADLLRGVLSQDLAYDLLTDNRVLALRLLEASGAVLREPV